MSAIPAQPELQLSVVLRFLNMRLTHALNSMRFLECMKDFLEGIGYRPGVTPAALVPAYTQACEQHYQPLIDAHPHLLENYLLNHIFKSLFPYGSLAEQARANSGPAHEYLILCAHYTLIKGLLIGIAGRHRDQFNLGHVVKLVQSYGRMIEHHAQFVDEIVAWLQAQSLGEAGGMAMLLRN